jgi:hypothetical protein
MRYASHSLRPAEVWLGCLDELRRHHEGLGGRAKGKVRGLDRARERTRDEQVKCLAALLELLPQHGGLLAALVGKSRIEDGSALPEERRGALRVGLCLALDDERVVRRLSVADKEEPRRHRCASATTRLSFFIHRTFV